MGSFYTTCSISHLTITNQKTSIQLLAPSYSTDYNNHLSMVVGDGSSVFFEPFAFPIHGYYYDYGYLRDVVMDKNALMLEEFFNLSIDDIISNVGDVDSGLKGKDGGEVRNLEVLEKLGMTYIRTEVLIHLETGWDKLKKKQNDTYSAGNMIHDFIHALSKKKKHEYTKDEIFSKLNDTDLSQEEMIDLKDKLLDLMDIDLSYTKSYVRGPVRYNMFNLLPITDEFKTEILKQFKFLTTLSLQLNRVLVPSVYGSQQTNWSGTLDFNKFVNALIEEDIQEEFEDVKEWYTDDNGVLDVEGFIEDYPGYEKFLKQ